MAVYIYQKTMLIGDFNLTIDNKSLENFMTTFDLECLIKKLTCFQSSNPTCIDLILRNKKEFSRGTNNVLRLTFYLTGVHIWDQLQRFGQVGKQRLKCRAIRTRERAQLAELNELVSDCKYMALSRAT